MRGLARIIMLSAAVMAGGALAADIFPTKTVRIVTGYPPGSTTDNISRLVAERLAVTYGQSVIVDNRAGASGNIGAAAVAHAAPDGHTILLTSDNAITTNLHLFKDMGFDPSKDLTPITIAAANIIALAAYSGFAPTSVRELIAYAEANPGKVSFGSSGIGSPHHLAGELLKARTKIDINHVAYKGGGPALVDLAGGHVPIAFVSLSAALPLVKEGRIKLLAITEAKRYPDLPNVPAVAETVPGFELTSWLGFFAPANTPAPVMTILNKSISAALREKALGEKLLAVGLVPVGNGTEEAKRVVDADTKLRGEIVRISGAKLD